jgi:transcriptional regulator with XRE-family HTH domain
MTLEAFGPALRRRRQELGLSLRALQSMVRYDFTYLGQVERGEKPGSADLAAACDEALGTGDELAALYDRGIVVSDQDPSDRVTPSADIVLLEASSAAAPPACPQRTRSRASASMTAGRFTRESDRHVAQLGSDQQVAQLDRWETESATLRALYHRAPNPVALLELTRGILERITDQLRSGVPPSDLTRLQAVRAEIAVLGGRLAFFDLGDPLAARAYYTVAQEAAIQAGDDALVAAALGHLAFAPAREGDTSAALAYLGEAVAHARRSGLPALCSWLSAVEAELVSVVDPTAALQAIDHARLSLCHARDGEAPGWFDYYSPARLEGFAGAALLAAGRPAQARQALEAALAGLEHDAIKQRAVFLLDLAETYLAGDRPDLDGACGFAVEAAALLISAGYASGRQRLERLRDRMVACAGRRRAITLDEALARVPGW